MQAFHKLDEVAADSRPSVITIGNFDGLHLAHQAVIARVVERARTLKVRSLLVTFDPHPVRILRPDAAPKLLTPLPEKLNLLQHTGLDAVLVLPFSRDLSMMPPFQFAEEIIASALHATEVHEGFNFRFGHRAEGDTAHLVEFGRKLGFDVVVYPPREIRGRVVSSSQVRRLIGSGDMDGARRLLGRSFAILSNPAPGRGYGSRYTVPTVNLGHYGELVPALGVYVTLLRLGEETFRSVSNIGNRPTFGADSFAIESHILDFHPIELTAQTPLELTFLTRLRTEQKFASAEALRAQIQSDVARTRRYFHLLDRFARPGRS